MDNLSYAVLVETENGLFFPVSYGETEWECALWLNTHKERFAGSVVAICHIIE